MDNYKGFTPEQIDAITMDNNNIIVSAGAGSGKTTVLTKRVIRKLLEGTHINELLILTFTNKDFNIPNLNIPAVDLSGSTNASNSRKSTIVNNFYQTNNSPVPLNRLDIYRQTKNILNIAR